MHAFISIIDFNYGVLNIVCYSPTYIARFPMYLNGTS